MPRNRFSSLPSPNLVGPVVHRVGAAEPSAAATYPPVGLLDRHPPWGPRGLLAAAAVAAGLCTGAASAQGTMASAYAPSSVFGQVGTVRSTRSATLGATWDWSASWALGPGRLGGYWEASAAAWTYRAVDGERRELAQIAAKPVFRYRFDGGASPWFAEGGVGLTLTSRLYHTERKNFSTAFNFGDHLAVGRSFGEGRNQELALRVEHFSNGSIKQPNPGETFLQLRYSYRFR